MCGSLTDMGIVDENRSGQTRIVFICNLITKKRLYSLLAHLHVDTSLKYICGFFFKHVNTVYL